MSDKQEIFAYRGRGFEDDGLPRCVVHQLEQPTQQARFAMTIIERWAMVASKDDGEDSVGRHKLALMPVDEVIGRACQMAQGAFEEFRNREWLDPVPTLAKLDEEIKERENKRENDK
jgi:hypothetical protein